MINGHDGLKIKTKVKDGENPDASHTTKYINAAEYEDGKISFISSEEGRVVWGEDGKAYPEYFLKDHLGNTRARIADKNQDNLVSIDPNDPENDELMNIRHYYPFGMEWDTPLEDVGGNSLEESPVKNKYTYNGKELVDDLDINWHYYGFRVYDPAIGRFTSVDPIAEEFAFVSGFNYAENEPVGSIDLHGLQRVKVNGNYLKKERNSIRRQISHAGFYLKHKGIANRVGKFKSGSSNISSVSARTSRHVGEFSNMDIGIGSERNAYRHVFWQAKITQEFGAGIADEIGKAHESIAAGDRFEINYDEAFEGTESGADSTVDLLNNVIGQSVGEANPNATNTQLGVAVLNEFMENGFFVSSTDSDGNISITRQKLTKKQYNNARSVLESLDKNGLTDDEK